MLKTMGIIVGGMFVGAVAVEIVREKCPRIVNAFYEKVNHLAGREIRKTQSPWSLSRLFQR